jgi:hypothetical protein
MYCGDARSHPQTLGVTGIKMLAIGVGCFWFSPKRTTSNRGKYKSPSLKEHLADIKSAMASIDNISELEVPQWKDEVQFATSAITIEEPNEEEDNNEKGEEDNPDNPPLISSGSIEFTLQIPFRVQETYGLGQTIEVEEFRVSVKHPYYYPVTFIHYEAVSERHRKGLKTGSPSESMG